MRTLLLDGLSAGKHKKTLQKVLEQIAGDDLRSCDLKKLGSGPYYRAKLDYENRLLVRFGRRDGQTVCFVLEIIEGHAYDRSRFLRGARFDESMLESQPPVGAPDEATELRYLHPTRDRFRFLAAPLSLDDAQDAALRTRAPLVVLGSAGSGKTAVTISRLRSTPGVIAYVTQSAYLAETARALFEQGNEDDDREAEFLSFAELLASHKSPPGKPITFARFRPFFEAHRTKLKFASAHAVFEEFRGVLGAQPEGPLSRDAYLGLGVRQSIFLGAEREAVFEAFSRYRPWLDASGYWDSNLVAHAYLPDIEPRWDFLVVDEVQDFTNAELATTLRGLKQPTQFLLSGDANQIVHPNFFSWQNLRSFFFRDASAEAIDRVHVLSSNYRNASAITTASNRLLRLKHARFGSMDRESDTLARATSDEGGVLLGLTLDGRSGDSGVKAIDAATRRSAKTAIVVLREEDKEAARKLFATPLVFSVLDVKGLEYESVVLYGLVSAEPSIFDELVAGISSDVLDREGDLKYARGKDKTDKSVEAYKFFVNALYVALTRALRRVIVVEPGRAASATKIWELLGVPLRRELPSLAADESSLLEWQREARKLELQGKSEQAEAIRSSILKCTPVPWAVFDGPKVDELVDKAVNKGEIFKKAKQQVFEIACFHDDRLMAARMTALGFAPTPLPPNPAIPLAARQHDSVAQHTRAQRERSIPQPYKVANHREVLAQVDKHGIEHRTPWGLTPLMQAVVARNLELAEELVRRGASLASRDLYGRTPVSWCLAGLLLNAAPFVIDQPWARGGFGALFERVAPAELSVEIGPAERRRLVKLTRRNGEYMIWLAIEALFRPHAYVHTGARYFGFESSDVVQLLEAMPDSVVPPNRKKRTYVNGVLARSEVDSTYATSRQLWQRESRGVYLPARGLALAVGERAADGTETFVDATEVLGIARTESFLPPHARGRLTVPGKPGDAPRGSA
ncbi:MAG: AAA family ATPase [Polyangiaceae bacterium]